MIPVITALIIIGLIVLVGNEHSKITRRQRERGSAARPVRSRGGHRPAAAPASCPPLASMPPVALETQAPDPGGIKLDPDWEWRFIPGAPGRPEQWVKTRCRHLKVDPVVARDGSIPAQLCLTCQTQFDVPITP